MVHEAATLPVRPRCRQPRPDPLLRFAERDLADGDDAIKEKIATARQHWKQRALSDTQTPPHSFTLVFATDGLMLAAPDENLRRFADRLLELAGWGPDRQAKRGENPISSDFLYLQNPVDDAYYGFQFNIDFFAAAGDKRWWHDHRLPGGIGFTANSTGHMKPSSTGTRKRAATTASGRKAGDDNRRPGSPYKGRRSEEPSRFGPPCRRTAHLAT